VASDWAKEKLLAVAHRIANEPGDLVAILEEELLGLLEAGERYRTFAAASGDDHDAYDAAKAVASEGKKRL